MLKKDYPTQYCPVASTLEVIGERWTLLVIRDIFLGIRRFEDIQRDLGVARNVLQDRLEGLVEQGIVIEAALPGPSGALRVPPHREGRRPVAGARGAAPVGGPPRPRGRAADDPQPSRLWRRARRPASLHGVRGRRLGDRGHRRPHGDGTAQGIGSTGPGLTHPLRRRRTAPGGAVRRPRYRCPTWQTTSHGSTRPGRPSWSAPSRCPPPSWWTRRSPAWRSSTRELNAIIHELYDRARTEAAGELPDGPFRGVPFLLKDLCAELAGTPYSEGTDFSG